MDRPRVVVHSLASVDGRLTLSPDVLLLHGDERWHNAAGSSEDVYTRLKATYLPQAFLEGSGSFTLRDQGAQTFPAVSDTTPSLNEDFLPEHVIQRPNHQGWFTVVDSRGRVRWSFKEWPDPGWQGWHLLVLVSHATPPEYLAFLRDEDIPYLISGRQQVDLANLLNKMRTQLGVETLVSTGGGRLNGALLRSGLVDDISLELFPAIIGGEGTPALFDSPVLGSDEQPAQLELISSSAEPSGHLRLQYRVVQ
jgi:riboflavin biosynthesis pyrimidine reductase